MDEIKFDRKNYRKHSDSNKEKIAKSLEECGAGRSIVIDNEGEIIAGNGVYEQAQKAGMKVKVVETDGTELVVVKRTDLQTEDEKRKRLAMADNATADRVEWDMENLLADFKESELGDWGVDIEVAMDEDALNDLFENSGESKQKGIKIEVVVPLELEDKVEDIKQSVSLTCQEWQGIKVK